MELHIALLFHKETINCRIIQPMVQSTCKSMTDLCEYDGNFVHKLNKFVEPVDDPVMFIVDQ